MSARDDFYVLAGYAEGMSHTSPVPQINEVFDEIDRLRALVQCDEDCVHAPCCSRWDAGNESNWRTEAIKFSFAVSCTMDAYLHCDGCHEEIELTNDVGLREANAWADAHAAACQAQRAARAAALDEIDRLRAEVEQLHEENEDLREHIAVLTTREPA